MFYKIIFIILLFTSISGLSQSTTQQAQISILTCDSGDEMYTTFGHSAIRVYYPSQKRDLVYNYGTFSFDEPNFYIKFMQGKLLYKLARTSYDNFLGEYYYFKRGVVEQVLDLDSLQTDRMIAFLENNYKPENRSYKYDFIFDNCSTRIRDILESEMKVDFIEVENKNTFRDQLNEKLESLVWSDFGINLLIGSVADREPDLREKMFLPNYLHDQFANATIDGRNLVKDEITVLSFPEMKIKRARIPFIKPFLVYSLIFIIILLLDIIYKHKAIPVLDIISFSWFMIMAIFSIVVFLMWFASDHIGTSNNWNLMWCNPLFIWLVIKYRSIRKSEVMQNVVFVLLGLLVLFCLIQVFSFQDFHMSFLPLILMSFQLLLRELRLSSVRSKSQIINWIKAKV